MSQRAEKASARGLIIINDEDSLFVAGSSGGYSADIPVVAIKSSDGIALMQAGDSSLLSEMQAPSRQNGLKPLPDTHTHTHTTHANTCESSYQWKSWDSAQSWHSNQTSDPLAAQQHPHASGSRSLTNISSEGASSSFNASSSSGHMSLLQTKCMSSCHQTPCQFPARA